MELKNILCSNPNCRQILGQIDGENIIPENSQVLSKLVSHKKKQFNPLYCVSCGRITRWYKQKFQSNLKRKFEARPKLKKL